jgi:hypothetical protein
MCAVILVLSPILCVSAIDVGVAVVVVRDIFIVGGFVSVMCAVVVFMA